MYYKRLKIGVLFLFTVLQLGCGASGSNDTASSQKLLWQAPSQRANGERLTKEELAYYEIWAGYTAETLLWIYSYHPTQSDQAVMQLNINELLSNVAPAEESELHSSNSENLYFGIIAVDSDGHRSMMSELKQMTIAL